MMRLEKKYKNRGFIALVSAIIISVVLLVFTATLSYSLFFARYVILESEYKERSLALAEGCVDVALLKLANDPNYTGNELVTIGSDICTIRAIGGSSNKVIETQAIFPQSNTGAYTDLRVTVDPNTLAVISWNEIASF